MPRSDGSFRLGRERFARKLAFELGDDIDIDAIARDARALLVQTQGEMVETAKQIWVDDKLGKLPRLDTPAQRRAFVKRVLDHVASDHPTNQTILADAKKWLERTTAFVRDNNLVRVPDEPVAVIEMPEYKRGVSIGTATRPVRSKRRRRRSMRSRRRHRTGPRRAPTRSTASTTSRCSPT